MIFRKSALFWSKWQKYCSIPTRWRFWAILAVLWAWNDSFWLKMAYFNVLKSLWFQKLLIGNFGEFYGQILAIFGPKRTYFNRFDSLWFWKPLIWNLAFVKKCHFKPIKLPKSLPGGYTPLFTLFGFGICQIFQNSKFVIFRIINYEKRWNMPFLSKDHHFTPIKPPKSPKIATRWVSY